MPYRPSHKSAHRYKEGGGSVVAREFTNDKATDFRAILTNIKGKRADLVFYGGMDAQGGPMVAQLKSLGIKAAFLSGDGSQSAEFLKLAGPAADGAMASSPGLPLDKMPGGKSFAERFNAKYGEIQVYAPFAYDAAMTVVEAMKNAKSIDPAKFLPEIAKTARQGVSGPIAFDDKGDLQNGPITVYEVKGGKWEALETVGGATPEAAAPAPPPAPEKAAAEAKK